MSVILGIGPDKWLHFIVSLVLSWMDPTVAILAGIGKEIWDQVADEWADLAADLAGVLLAMALGA